MITILLFDFSRVLLFPKDPNYSGTLNGLYKEKRDQPNFSFCDHFEFNEELLKYLKQLKSRYPLNIFTSDIIQNDPAARKVIEPLFNHIFSAKDLGFSKKDPHVYRLIATKLSKTPEEILFVDDQEAYVAAANKARLETIKYQSNKYLLKEFKNYSIKSPAVRITDE